MDIDSIKDTYFAECTDQLSELETGLFSISSDGPDAEVVNSVFRAVHSIKGGAGAFALDDLVNFAHVFENALDVIRNDLSQSTEQRVELLLRSSDKLSDIVAAARDSGDPIDYSDLAAELEREFDLSSEEEEEIEFDAVPISLDDFSLEPETSTGSTYDIRFVPKNELFLHGHDPQRIFRELQALGAFEIVADTENVVALDDHDLRTTNLAWSITLTTEAPEDELRVPFEWVEELCTLTIEKQGAAIIEEGDDPFADMEDLDIGSEDPEDEPFSIVSDEDEPSIAAFDDEMPLETGEALSEKDAPTLVEVTAETGTEEVATDDASAAKGGKPKAKVSKPIRVDSEKVDRLMNLMGEMVISQSMLASQINTEGFGAATPTGLALVDLQNLTREIQSSVMAIRAQPIKPVFMRMSRVVREVCSATGKKANLVLEGESTEVDTTVIEGLSDPLTHMIRNSIDHGIESAEKRAELGKPSQGTVTLSASHSSGSIMIEIRDDGAGINREKVLSLAVEKGIVRPEAKLTDDEIDNLIFAPGFSTSAEITDVSGRGVGMDVVRQSIQGLGGRVSITSEPGEGSHFTLHLPLTLAILDGMLVRSAEQMLVLPVTSVVETMRLRTEDVFLIGDSRRVFKLRDQLIPIVDIGTELGFASERSEKSDGTVIIVESGKSEMSAFIVDSIVGQQQVVIKSMESNYRRIPCIAAATILGNGRIALILDVAEIVSRKVSETPIQPVLDQTA